MRRARGRVAFALLMLPVLSLACGENSTPTPAQRSNLCELCLREIVSEEWQKVTIQEVVDGEETPDKECAVFYRAGDP